MALNIIDLVADRLYLATTVDMTAALTLQEEGICEKVKQYPVLFDEQLKGYTEKDAVILRRSFFEKRR